MRRASPPRQPFQTTLCDEPSRGNIFSPASFPDGATQPAALRGSVTAPHELYEWQAGDAQNPYFAYLACAERLIVTFDSISMLSEACATGRPVYMFDLAHDHGDGERRGGADHSVRSLGYALLMRFGPRRLGRDIGLVHEQLLRDGRAAWLGAAEEPRPGAPSADIDRAVARVRALLDQG